MDNARRVSAFVLIALGVVFLVVQQAGVGGEAIVLAIGAAFLVAYAMTGTYGFLVPGGIMTGLGAGILYNAQTGNGGAVVLGLGLGFLSIYVLSRRVPAGWWPLIPGGILTVIGLATAANREGLLGEIARWWPVALILAGLAILLRRRNGAVERDTVAPYRPDDRMEG